MNKPTRLDRAVATLQAIESPATDVERWDAASAEMTGFELTGASDQLYQAIEEFGVRVNSIMSAYKETALERELEKWDSDDLAELVKLAREFAETVREVECNRILDRLRNHQRILPEAEIIEARRHRDWFAPILLRECQASIDRVVKLAEKQADEEEDEWDSIPLFAITLFSEWNFRESVPIILAPMMLPEEIPFDLFGDTIHEYLPRYLAQFLSDEIDGIDKLILNPDGNTYVRWAAAGSYRYLVRDKVLSTKDAVGRLDRLFRETQNVDEEGHADLGHCYELSAGIVETIISIGGCTASTIFDEQDQWKFVDTSIVAPDSFTDSVEEDLINQQKDLQRLPQTQIEDVVESLRWWAAFDKTDEASTKLEPVTRPSKRPKPKRSDRAHQVPEPAGAPVASTRSARVPRNAKCPCGSGRKYKQCCMRTSMLPG